MTLPSQREIMSPRLFEGSRESEARPERTDLGVGESDRRASAEARL